MRAITLSAPATLTKPLPRRTPHQIATASQINLGQDHPTPTSHAINVSGLDQDVSQTRQPMSYSSAPSPPPPAVEFLEPIPPKLTSLAQKMVAANSANSNAPPTGSYSPFPPNQTHLNW